MWEKIIRVISKVFLDHYIEQFFFHSRSEQFLKQNTIYFVLYIYSFVTCEINSRASKYLQYFTSEGYSGIRFEYVIYWRAKKRRILLEFLKAIGHFSKKYIFFHADIEKKGQRSIKIAKNNLFQSNFFFGKWWHPYPLNPSPLMSPSVLNQTPPPLPF